MMIDVRPFEQPVERALDQHLRRAVDVGGRLVEDEDARIREQGARDRDQLALARRQAGSALAHLVVESARKPCGDAVDPDGGRGRGNLLVRRVGLREADVRGDRAAEEERILEHDAELAPVRAQLDIAQVVAVHADRAPARVVVAADQPRERRLAVARLPDEREAPPGRDMERDPVQHGLLAVREDDGVDVEIALEARQRLRAGPVVDLRLLVEDARDLHHRRARRLQLPVDVRQLLQRLEDELEEEIAMISVPIGSVPCSYRCEPK